MSVDDNLRAAWAALLRGDTDERDRQCDLAKAALEDEKTAGLRRLMETDFFVTPDGRVIPITIMMGTKH